MREMVLNHASLAHATHSQTDAWLKDVATGIRALVRSGAVQRALRTDRPVYEIPCPEGRSLWEAWDGLRRATRQGPEEVRWLGELLTKAIVLEGATSEQSGRLSTCEPVRCEAKTLPPSELEFGPDGRYDLAAGRPLVYCAITDGIAVSFPSERAWDGDRMTVVRVHVLARHLQHRRRRARQRLSQEVDRRQPPRPLVLATSFRVGHGVPLVRVVHPR